MDRDGAVLSWHPFGRNDHDFAACPEHALAEIVEHIVNFRVIQIAWIILPLVASRLPGIKQSASISSVAIRPAMAALGKQARPAYPRLACLLLPHHRCLFGNARIQPAQSIRG